MQHPEAGHRGEASRGERQVQQVGLHERCRLAGLAGAAQHVKRAVDEHQRTGHSLVGGGGKRRAPTPGVQERTNARSNRLSSEHLVVCGLSSPGQPVVEPVGDQPIVDGRAPVIRGALIADWQGADDPGALRTQRPPRRKQRVNVRSPVHPPHLDTQLPEGIGERAAT